MPASKLAQLKVHLLSESIKNLVQNLWMINDGITNFYTFPKLLNNQDPNINKIRDFERKKFSKNPQHIGRGGKGFASPFSENWEKVSRV